MQQNTNIHVCPWCNSPLPEKWHTVDKVLGMYLIGCPKYSREQPTFLNKQLYKIHSPGKIIV